MIVSAGNFLTEGNGPVDMPKPLQVVQAGPWASQSSSIRADSVAPTPTSTPMEDPSLTCGGPWPPSMQKQANHLPEVRLMVTSRMYPSKRKCSTIATGSILDKLTA